MLRIAFLTLFSMSLIQFSFAEQLPIPSLAEVNSAYKLGAGDIITIRIYDEPDMSLEEVGISLAGTISFPLLGQVKVSGLSPEELEESLINGLKGPYLVDPSVTVSIDEYRPFYVIGEVKKPGGYSFHPGLTVDKAVSISGGFTERASKGSIYVIHDQVEASQESQEKIPAELFDVVQPGDVITVEQSFF